MWWIYSVTHRHYISLSEDRGGRAYCIYFLLTVKVITFHHVEMFDACVQKFIVNPIK